MIVEFIHQAAGLICAGTCAVINALWIKGRCAVGAHDWWEFESADGRTRRWCTRCSAREVYCLGDGGRDKTWRPYKRVSMRMNKDERLKTPLKKKEVAEQEEVVGVTLLAQCRYCPGREECLAWQDAQAAAERGEKVRVTLGACQYFNM